MPESEVKGLGELSLILNNIDLYMLVFARMAGIILFNPLLSRNSIPAALRTAIAFGVTILITPMVPIPAGYDSGAIDFPVSYTHLTLPTILRV